MARAKNTLGYQWKPTDPPAGSSENIFSNDEEETKFIKHVAKVKKAAWVASTMQWNTIHGIPWKRCEALGVGGYGSVYLGMRQDKKLFAVKSIKIEYPARCKATAVINCQMTEIKMMRYLRSRYIVRCLGCGRSNGDNSMDGKEALDVFLEYVVRGSLKHVIETRKKPFEETPYVRQYTYDILKALQYMKQQQVVHGDIKMANLLLSDDCVKLADWGGAKQLTRSSLKTLLIGTTGFKSPEVESKKMQGHPSDIFSLGCTVIEMITGSRPNQVLRDVKITEGRLRPKVVPMYVPEIPQNVSPECQDFLKQCLCHSNVERWTAAELLHHPFVTNRDTTSPLPYGMAVPTLLGATLLRPPRRTHPEIPDGKMPAKVKSNLDAVSKSWVPNLMLCTPTDPQGPQPQAKPQASAPSIKLSSRSSPAPAPITSTPTPLPSLVADLSVTANTNLPNEWVEALLGDQKPSRRRARAQKPSKQQPEITDSPGNNPVVERKQFEDALFHSSSLMGLMNDDILSEARVASLQPLPDDDVPDILFPNDPDVARTPDRRDDNPGGTPASKRRQTSWAGCAGSLAADAVPPVIRPPAVKKKRQT